jgi:hypothetical protein
METSEYFHNRVETFLTYMPDRTLNAGIDVVTDIIVYDMASPCTDRGYKYALAAWLQGRNDVWQDRIDEYKSNPTDENLANIARHAINEHTPHTQSDFDDLVEYSYRFAINETLIENELKRRSNDNGER